VRTLRYGDAPSQVAELHLPEDDPPDGAPPRVDGAAPVVVLLHGGFWRSSYDLTLMDPLAADLVARGWAALNVEYRRVGEDGGGWPGTFADVGAAIDTLADSGHAIDADRVVTVGHSAGGHLALWSAARAGLPAGTPGADPAVVPRAAVGQAPVADLVDGAETDLGGGACVALLGGAPAEVPERYQLASPAARVPISVPQLLVHGTADDIVPIRQSERHLVAATAAGDDATIVRVDGGDHLTHLDAASPAWFAVVDRLPAFVA
jgi:acetyl esterase/lipase